MAGVKGRSGGARKGAGAKPKAVAYLPDYGAAGEDPLDFLACVYRDPKAPAELRVRAATTATQYSHVRTKDGGKKVLKSQAAEKASGGKFAPASPPLSIVAGGKS